MEAVLLIMGEGGDRGDEAFVLVEEIPGDS